MSTPRLTLYFGPGSSSMAPHIALHEIGVPFESRPLSFKKREHQAPAYRAINPEGKVPTLMIDDRIFDFANMALRTVWSDNPVRDVKAATSLVVLRISY